VNSDGHLYEGKMHSSDDTGMFSPIVLIFNHYLPFGRDFSVLKFSTVKSGKKNVGFMDKLYGQAVQ